jgi:hypothetical protein
MTYESNSEDSRPYGAEALDHYDNQASGYTEGVVYDATDIVNDEYPDDMGSDTSDRLSRVCANGRGTVIVALKDTPHLEQVSEIVGNLDSGAAYLTPLATEVCHPLTTQLEPGNVYRGTFDWRSFSVTTTDIPYSGSVTVKGGDVSHMQQICSDWESAPASRILKKQIPGAALPGEATHEFSMARDMQGVALSHLGRLTYTALPLRVNTIETVTNRAGEHLSIRNYLNSNEYMTAPDWLRQSLDMKPGEGLGDVLIGRYGLQAAQYLYATAGLNIRVKDVVNGRHFRSFDQEGHQHGIDDRLLRDPLSSFVEGLEVSGDYLPKTADRKDVVFRRIYGLLGDAYGFDADEVLPRTPVNDATYFKNLRTIPAVCQRQGVDEIVLTGFISRITEVAALLHAQEMTFSRAPRVGSSLVARNVTYDGVVLDLDTAGTLVRVPESHIVQDYSEMLLTIAGLRRVVRTDRSPELSTSIWAAYREKLTDFGVAPTWAKRIEAIVDISPSVARMTDML